MAMRPPGPLAPPSPSCARRLSGMLEGAVPANVAASVLRAFERRFDPGQRERLLGTVDYVSVFPVRAFFRFCVLKRMVSSKVRAPLRAPSPAPGLGRRPAARIRSWGSRST